jgi:8-oxo-dGTP pyrophosphatase MutT (NUDIX family)
MSMVGHLLGAASVIVDRDSRVLLVKHNYGPHNWEIPGGGAEARESIEETARREAREELGISLKIERLTGAYWEPGRSDGRAMHHIVFLAQLHPASPTPRVVDRAEITDLGWFAPTDLPRPISDFTVRRIEDALSGAGVAVHEVAPRTWLR